MVTKTILDSREAWLKHRFKGIGGSEAAAVIGLNPYMSNEKLWEIKTGLREPDDISDNPLVKYGTLAEAPLREIFKLDFPHYEVFYEENNSFSNGEYPFALASLDGWLRDEAGRLGVLEIKTTSVMNSMHKEKWNEQIPQNYFVQLLHNMMVINADFAVLKAQLKYDIGGDITHRTKHYFFERADHGEDIIYLAEQERLFWKKVKTMERPALLLPEI